jgi:hypothetical protein
MFFLFNGAFRLTPIQSQAVAMLQVTLRSSPLPQTERLLSFGTKFQNFRVAGFAAFHSANAKKNPS